MSYCRKCGVISRAPMPRCYKPGCPGMPPSVPRDVRLPEPLSPEEIRLRREETIATASLVGLFIAAVVTFTLLAWVV